MQWCYNGGFEKTIYNSRQLHIVCVHGGRPMTSSIQQHIATQLYWWFLDINEPIEGNRRALMFSNRWQEWRIKLWIWLSGTMIPLLTSIKSVAQMKRITRADNQNIAISNNIGITSSCLQNGLQYTSYQSSDLVGIIQSIRANEY